MTDHTPSAGDLLESHAHSESYLNGTPWEEGRAEARRAIAKIKAAALREHAETLYVRAEDPQLVGLDVRFGGYYTGIRSARKKEIQELLIAADRIEKEAGINHD